MLLIIYVVIFLVIDSFKSKTLVGLLESPHYKGPAWLGLSGQAVTGAFKPKIERERECVCVCVWVWVCSCGCGCLWVCGCPWVWVR